VKVVQ
jgi:hypothetical protein